MLTAIPLVAWDPVGPAVSFTLYHNSLAAPYETDHSAWGFDLGNGWSVSYGGHIEGSGGDAFVTVVEADARRNVFALLEGQYVPPAGVHDRLVWTGSPTNQWTLTSPEQSQAIFDDAGRLIEVHDSSGSVSAVHRDGQDRIDYVKSAADDFDEPEPVVGKNRLELTYDGNGRLDTLTDPIGRVWTFDYDGSGRLWKVNYPHDLTVPESYVEILYENGSSNRIQHIRSRTQRAWRVVRLRLDVDLYIYRWQADTRAGPRPRGV